VKLTGLYIQFIVKDVEASRLEAESFTRGDSLVLEDINWLSQRQHNLPVFKTGVSYDTKVILLPLPGEDFFMKSSS
jgi:hypothetical protein